MVPPALVLLVVVVGHVSGQLIGHRGVFTLPEGQEYRDALTRDASRSHITANLILPLLLQERRQVCHRVPGQGGYEGEEEIQKAVKGSKEEQVPILRSQSASERKGVETK